MNYEKIINLVESWIEKLIENPVILNHHLRTRDYLLILDSKVSIESQISALTYDIERQMEDKVPTPKNEKEYDEAYLINHGKNSAKYVINFLEENDLEIDFNKLSFLISNHEAGGNYETNLLRDADSLSFLEVVVEGFAKKYSKEFSRHKFKYMLERIENKKAKELAKPLFEEAMKLLD